MKKLKNQTVLLQIFLSLFFAFSLSANTVFPITSSDIGDAYDHVDLTFANQVQISESTFTSHLNSIFALNTYDSQLAAPLPNITLQNTSEVSFSWSSISSANSYRVEYINLENGSNNFTTSNNADVDFNNLNSALYLFSFLSISGTDQSKVNAIVVDLNTSFIIVDTEILLQGPLADEFTCDCTPIDSIDTQEQENIISTAFIPWQSATTKQRYEVNIDVSGASETYSKSVVFIKNDTNNIVNTYFVSTCDSTYSSTSPYKIGIIDVAEATVSKEGIHLYFPLDDLTSYTVQTSLCQSAAVGRKSSVETIANNFSPTINTVRTFPNPVITGELLQLQFQLPQASELSISIYDAMGRKIRTISERVYLQAGAYEKSIAADTLPKGHFYWVLQTDQNLLSIPFIKME